MRKCIDVVQPAGAATAVTEALQILETRVASADHPSEIPVVDHLALLACGRFEPARQLLRIGVSLPDLPLIASRYVSWSGDLSAVAAIWDVIRGCADELARGNPLQHDWLRMRTWSELQRTATDVGDPGFAATLHRRATGTDAVPAPHVPDLHGAQKTSGEARTILEFVHGVLGAGPDATRHRLRLRPRLPIDTTRTDEEVEVRDIQFGDGAVRIAGTSEPLEPPHAQGRRFTWRVAQDAGAIPITVLLEPVIGGSVSATSVDGQTAVLSPKPFGDLAIVPVQLVLDGERTLLIDVTG